VLLYPLIASSCMPEWVDMIAAFMAEQRASRPCVLLSRTRRPRGSSTLFDRLNSVIWVTASSTTSKSCAI
jgi:hypothetical protein